MSISQLEVKRCALEHNTFLCHSSVNTANVEQHFLAGNKSPFAFVLLGSRQRQKYGGNL